MAKIRRAKGDGNVRVAELNRVILGALNFCGLALSGLWGSLWALSRAEGSARAPCLPGFILLRGFSGAGPVVSIQLWSPSQVYPNFRFGQSLIAICGRFYSPGGLLMVPGGYVSFLAWGWINSSCGGAYGLCPKPKARRERLDFRGLSCWEASVTLYLWFRFQSMIAICSCFCSPEGLKAGKDFKKELSYSLFPVL